jgi:hypothetical protein
MMFRHYIHTLRVARTLLVLSALVGMQDAICTWRSYCGLGLAAAASSMAVAAERQHINAHTQPIAEEAAPCAYERVNTLVQSMCEKHGVTADVYCSEDPGLALSHMCAIDAYAMPYGRIAYKKGIDGAIIIYKGWADSAEEHLKSLGDQNKASVSRPSSARNMAYMAMYDPQDFIQAFTAILEHEIMHIKHRYYMKVGILAAISPCAAALSYVALSRVQDALVPSNNWTSYVLGAVKTAAVSAAAVMGMRWYRRHAEWQADEGITQPSDAFAEILENLAEKRESKWSPMFRFIGTHPLSSERAQRVRERIA